MPGPESLSELVYQELHDRYYRRSRRSGPGPVRPPDRALAEALANAVQATPGLTSVEERLHHAGDTYEYLVQRAHDPQWRALVAVAAQLDRLATTPARAHRSGGFYSSETLALGTP